jgi:vitamin B12 transporter
LYSIYGNRHLDPETGISYEGGIETLIAHDKLKLRGTAFDRNMKNIIGFYDNHYVNYNRQKEYGGEVELSYMINDQLRVKGYYAYVNGQVTVKNDRTKMDSTYNNLFKRPENSGGLSVGYQVTPSLYIDVDGKYTGACKDLTFINSPNEIRDLKSYILLNVYAQYTLRKKYKVFLGIYNATNSHFIETTGFATKGFNFDAGLQWSLF